MARPRRKTEAEEMFSAFTSLTSRLLTVPKDALAHELVGQGAARKPKKKSLPKTPPVKKEPSLP